MKREALANIAEAFAAKKVSDEKTNGDYMEMLKYYPENDADAFKNCWCCAAVYYCCREAGFDLPLGTHQTARKGHFRWFTSCIAWFEWGQVNGFTHNEGSDFNPQRGDIVIYNNIIPQKYKQKDSLWCDHIGVVLSCIGDTLTVAEGNVDNQNVSGIMKRKHDRTIGCYIRIPENYVSDEFIAKTTVEQTVDPVAEHSRFDVWYHGSPLELNELAAGSTITCWRELAEAFSHKPQTLRYDTVGGNISHNGQLDGFLYVVDEPVVEGVDIYKHPKSTMDDGVEWLTRRTLQLREISHAVHQ